MSSLENAFLFSSLTLIKQPGESSVSVLDQEPQTFKAYLDSFEAAHMKFIITVPSQLVHLL